MKKILLTLLTGILIGASFSALALYGNDAVKVTPLLKTQTSWNGDPIAYPDGKAEVSALIVEIAPGGETGWHQHSVPSFAYIMEGDIFVHLKDGSKLHIRKGEAMVEVVDTWHNGTNPGDTPAKLLVFYPGAENKTLTIQETEQAIEKL